MSLIQVGVAMITFLSEIVELLLLCRFIWTLTMDESVITQTSRYYYLMQLVVLLDNIRRISEALLLIEVRLLAPPTQAGIRIILCSRVYAMQLFITRLITHKAKVFFIWSFSIHYSIYILLKKSEVVKVNPEFQWSHHIHL